MNFNAVVSAIQLLAGIIIGAALVAGVIWLIPRLRIPRTVDRAKGRACMKEVASQMSWAMMSEGPEPVITLDRKGWRGRVEYRSGKRPATDVTFDLDGGVHGWLQVAPESVAHGMIKTFGVADLEVGDKDFDNAHEVSAGSEDFARRMLDADNRSMLRSIGARGDFIFRVTPNLLLLRLERHVYDPGVMETLIVTASNLFGSLDMPERGKIEVQEVRDALSSDSQCEICGSRFTMGTVVRCARCKTPHHRDCWEFNGVCSTFACGSKDWV